MRTQDAAVLVHLQDASQRLFHRGRVEVIAVQGTTAYIGGKFTKVG